MLKLDEEEMRAKTKELNDAVSEYLSFAQDPFSAELSYLDSMNTDFLAKFKTMIEDLDESNAAEIETIQEITDMADEIVDTFEDIDETAANAMGFTEEE